MDDNTRDIVVLARAIGGLLSTLVQSGAITEPEAEEVRRTVANGVSVYRAKEVAAAIRHGSRSV